MKGYDNSGRLVSEINSFRTSDGKCITTNTAYSTVNGQPTSQNVSIWEPNGKVRARTS